VEVQRCDDPVRFRRWAHSVPTEDNGPAAVLLDGRRPGVSQMVTTTGGPRVTHASRRASRAQTARPSLRVRVGSAGDPGRVRPVSGAITIH
jgi:hypothetical protein